MMLPPDIALQLGENAPQAHAALNCGLGGPIGETHLVVADGQLIVFTRDSMFGEFARHAASHATLEAGTFDDTLRLALADGSSHALNVSSFEKEAVVTLLAQAPVKVPPKSEPAPAVVSQKPPERQPAAPAPPAKYTPPKYIEVQKPRKDQSKRDWSLERRGIFYGSNTGCGGCLIMLVLFFGPIVGLWFAHIHAMASLGGLLDTRFADDDFTYVVTKIAAVIAGIYLGYQCWVRFDAWYEDAWFRGGVHFDGLTLRVIGERRSSEVTFDLGRPIVVALQAVKAKDEGDKGDPEGQPVIVLAYLRQGSSSAALRAMIKVSSASLEFPGHTTEWIDKEPANVRSLPMNEQNFNHVLERLPRT